MTEESKIAITRFTLFLSILSTSAGLLCFECSSPEGNCTRPMLGVTKNVTCDGFCYTNVSQSSISRGCINVTEQNCTQSRCCNTDFCNDVTPTTTPLTPVECYKCTYRVQADGKEIGHRSCTVDSFDPLHALVTTTTCDYGCSKSEVYADFGDGEEYILSRQCAQEGYCGDSCVHLDGYVTCTKCCDDDRCNGEEKKGKMSDENQCYSCSYIKGPSGSIGSPGCYEPFNASGEGITKVPCSGECSLSVVQDADSVIVERACQPGCQPSCTEFGDSKNCRYCCNGSLCNSSTSFHAISVTLIFRILSGVFFILLLYP